MEPTDKPVKVLEGIPVTHVDAFNTDGMNRHTKQGQVAITIHMNTETMWLEKGEGKSS